MKINKFRIKNYKSITDSGDCYLDGKLTILAGKNESGKTSILEALSNLNQDNKIDEEKTRPIGTKLTPEIHLTVILSKEEVTDVFEETGKDVPLILSDEEEINLIKTKDIFTLNSVTRTRLGFPDLKEKTKNDILTSQLKIRTLTKHLSTTGKMPALLQNQDFTDYKNLMLSFKEQNIQHLDIVSEVEKLENSIDKHVLSENDCSVFVEEIVSSKLPYFILFSSFEDNFPESIQMSELTTNEWAKDLEKVSGFSISSISSTSAQERAIHQNTVNVEFGEKFKNFWTQDDIKLQIHGDTDKINFWINENNITYYPSQRSRGQQWYLSFFIKIVARLKENKSNVILIDEPGLYLHAKAQKDLLKVLEEYTEENPVIFSTHSPYLITEKNIPSINLVEKDVISGTKILGKVHAHPTANRETLTPILTAIGIGLNDSILNFSGKNNIIVEGAEDTFYLRAFQECVNNDETINFINGGGSSNMGIMGSILEGWGAKVYYLYDNDKGKTDGVKKLLKDWKVCRDLIRTVSLKSNATIADILSIADFKKYVLDDTSNDYQTSNSEYIKSLGRNADKVLLARKFLKRVRSEEDISLSDESIENINTLFGKILL